MRSVDSSARFSERLCNAGVDKQSHVLRGSFQSGRSSRVSGFSLGGYKEELRNVNSRLETQGAKQSTSKRGWLHNKLNQKVFQRFLTHLLTLFKLASSSEDAFSRTGLEVAGSELGENRRGMEKDNNRRQKQQCLRAEVGH